MTLEPGDLIVYAICLIGVVSGLVIGGTVGGFAAGCYFAGAVYLAMLRAGKIKNG